MQYKIELVCMQRGQQNGAVTGRANEDGCNREWGLSCFIMFSLQIVLKVACYIAMVLEFWSGASTATGLYQHTCSESF